MKIYDESLYCQECNCEISVAQSKFCNNYCDDCYKLIEQQEMQVLDETPEDIAQAYLDKYHSEQERLDQAVDPDGLGPEGQRAWNAFQQQQEPADLCEGCHRTEEYCICGGVPDEF